MKDNGTIEMTIEGLIAAELQRAKVKFPTWPTDPLHAMGVVNEEIGELNKAVLETCYSKVCLPASVIDKVRSEAVQSAAMLRRFIEGLEAYKFLPVEQYEQRR